MLPMFVPANSQCFFWALLLSFCSLKALTSAEPFLATRAMSEVGSLRGNAQCKIYENPTIKSAYLDWNNRLWLLGENDSAVKKRRNNVVHKQVHSGHTFLFKIFIQINCLDDSRCQHPVSFPKLIILRNNLIQNFEILQHSKAIPYWSVAAGQTFASFSSARVALPSSWCSPLIHSRMGCECHRNLRPSGTIHDLTFFAHLPTTLCRPHFPRCCSRLKSRILLSGTA